MPTTDVFLSRLDSIHCCIQQLNAGLNARDSLTVSVLSDINANLSAQNHISFLGVSWDILLPTIISIIIFLLGYYITSLQAKRKIQKSRSLVKDTIVTWADSNSENLDKYVKSIRDLAERIGNSDNMSPQEFHIQHITIDVLSQFSIDRLTDALILGLSGKKDKKGENLNAYLQSVSYLINTHKFVLDYFGDYCLHSNDLFLQWSDKWRAFTKNCQMNNIRLDSKQPIDPEKIFYLNLVGAINASLNKNSDFAKYINLLTILKPLFDTPPIRTNEIFDTRNLFEDLYVIMIQVENIKQFKQGFLDCAERIEIAVDKFRKAVDFYRGQKMKYWA